VDAAGSRTIERSAFPVTAGKPARFVGECASRRDGLTEPAEAVRHVFGVCGGHFEAKVQGCRASEIDRYVDSAARSAYPLRVRVMLVHANAVAGGVRMLELVEVLVADLVTLGPIVGCDSGALVLSRDSPRPMLIGHQAKAATLHRASRERRSRRSSVAETAVVLYGTGGYFRGPGPRAAR
jgi:hypothetical protein